MIFVDPDVAVHESARHALHAAGYDVAVASDAAAALAQAEHDGRPVLVLMHTPDSVADCERASAPSPRTTGSSCACG